MDAVSCSERTLPSSKVMQSLYIEQHRMQRMSSGSDLASYITAVVSLIRMYEPANGIESDIPITYESKTDGRRDETTAEQIAV